MGNTAVAAMALARAEERAESLGWEIRWEDEDEPWDGENPAPSLLLCAVAYDAEGTFAGASLGMVGADSYRDPYLRVVAAEVLAEALDELDARAARETLRVSVIHAYTANGAP